MTAPVRANVDPATRDALLGLATGDLQMLEEMLAFRETEQASKATNEEQQQQQSPSPPPAAADGPSLLDQLNRLDALHQQGALTDNEFTAAKAKLLGS